MSLFRTFRPLLAHQPTLLSLRTFHTSISLRDSTPTAVLPRLRTQLKEAMRGPKGPRRDVLRSLIAEVINASKTAKPIETDAHLYTLLSKQITSSEKAAEEFAEVKRNDLVEKEQSHLSVLRDMRGEIPVLSVEETDRVIGEVVEKARGQEGGKLNMGKIMKGVSEELGGKVYDTKYVAEKVKELTSAVS